MRNVLGAATTALMLGMSAPSFAQTTAGLSTSVVFPVGAQTSSFASEMTLFNPGPNLLTATVHFYEANNSANPGVKLCNDVSVPAGRSAQITLATQCALVGTGGHFGLVVVTDKAVPPTHAFYGYMRVQNPQGIGFSIEGFPQTNFNNQVSHVSGLKRQASAPAYQTNCFAASLDQPVSYQLKLFNDSTGAQIGATLTHSLAAFQQFRYLDIFGVDGVNAPGDHANVRAQFTQTSGGSANLIGFCTVQDNASFGADFRIAKSFGSPSSSFFAQGGNALGTTAHLGTNDNQPLELYVNGQRAMRIQPSTDAATIIGGDAGNAVPSSVSGATIAGGGSSLTTCFDPLNSVNTAPCRNAVTGNSGAVGGGDANVVTGEHATIGGGLSNSADGDLAFVGGGFGNVAGGVSAVVAGGQQNIAAGDASVGGGSSNTASGLYATVPGGNQNQAVGTGSLAAGRNAVATHDGSFIWGDGSRWAGSAAINTFTVQATGGINLWPGSNALTVNWDNFRTCEIGSASSNWTCSSDRALKEHFVAIDKHALLDRLAAMPVESWTFKGSPDVMHIGPVAQDFHAAFAVGDRRDDLHIDIGDSQGIALAAIQGLYQMLRDKDAQIEAQRRELGALKARMDDLQSVRGELDRLRETLSEFDVAGRPRRSPH